MQLQDSSTFWMPIPLVVDSKAVLYFQVYPDKERSLVFCSHVDDLIIGGERGDAAWVIEELQKKFTLSGGVLIPTSDQNPIEPIRFLKKHHFFTAHGVVIFLQGKQTSESGER